MAFWIFRKKPAGEADESGFIKNLKCRPLTDDEQRALNIGAILTTTNFEFYNSLASKTDKKWLKKSRASIAGSWGIDSERTAAQTLAWLGRFGHRRLYNLATANAPECFSEDFSFKDFMDACERAGRSLADDYFAPEFADRLPADFLVMYGALSTRGDLLPLAQRSAKLLGEMNLELGEIVARRQGSLPEYRKREVFAKYREVLECDEKEFEFCIKIFSLAFDDFTNFVSCAGNLKKIFPLLLEKNYLAPDSENVAREVLRGIDVSAWDYGRMVNVARWSYEQGYITEAAAWEHIRRAHEECRRLYRSYADFARGYVIGRMLWHCPADMADFPETDETMKTVDELLNTPESPWLRWEWQTEKTPGDAMFGEPEEDYASCMAKMAYLGEWAEALTMAERAERYAALYGNPLELDTCCANALVNLSTKKDAQEPERAAMILEKLEAIARRHRGDDEIASACAFAAFNLHFAKESPEAEKALARIAPLAKKFDECDEIQFLHDELKACLGKGKGRGPQPGVAEKWRHMKITTWFGEDDEAAENEECRYCGGELKASMECKTCGRGNKCGYCGGVLGALGGKCRACGRHDNTVCFYCGGQMYMDKELKDYNCAECGRVRKY